MKHIEPSSLHKLQSRVEYTTSFLNFTTDDQAALYAAKPFVAPLIPDILDAVYTKLLSFDITANSFVPRNTGYADKTPACVEELHTSHPQIRYRMTFLKQYLVKLVTADYTDKKTFEYFDRIAYLHTGAYVKTGMPELRVEYIHIGLLLGYVVEILIPAVMALEIDTETKGTVLRAVNKVIWIQNDLFARHYIQEEFGQPSNIQM